MLQNYSNSILLHVAKSKGSLTRFWFLFAITAAGIVTCPRTSSIFQGYVFPLVLKKIMMGLDTVHFLIKI